MALNEVLLQQSFDLVCSTEREQHLFTEHFYQTPFAAYPQLQPLFAHTAMEDQKKKLMATLVFILQTLNKPTVLSPSVRKLGQCHTRVGVQAEHYPMVADALLATFVARLGSQWTEELQAAWKAAYETLATLMQEEGEVPS